MLEDRHYYLHFTKKTTKSQRPSEQVYNQQMDGVSKYSIFSTLPRLLSESQALC